jgi:hypothetical protein
MFHLDGKIPGDSWMRKPELMELWGLRLLLLETISWMKGGINGIMKIEIIIIGN